MPTLLVILGPTAVGKTALSIALAELYGCPIINADSRQLYADLPIGTAAPTIEEQARVKHYFVGCLPIQEYYSASRYEQEALTLIRRLFATHDVLILTGGSMMYINAVCHGIDDIPTIDEALRQDILARYERRGLEAMLGELRLLDSAYYDVVDHCNPRRVLHALEICYQTGQTYTSLRRGEKKQRDFRIIKIGLERPREQLFERINSRVTQMVEAGFIDEARRMLSYRSCNALNTVGYKEIFRYLDGEWPLPMALDRMRKNTRVYAKKQMTWFKKDKDILWFHPDEQQQIIDTIAQML